MTRRHDENDDLPAGIRAALHARRVMDDRRSGEDRREDEIAAEQPASWEKAALRAACVVLVAICSWLLNADNDSRKGTSARIDALLSITNQNSQEIAVMKESEKNLRESLDRIENALTEIRKAQGRR